MKPDPTSARIMQGFDDLPPRVREAFNNAEEHFRPIEVCEALKKGTHTEEQIIALLNPQRLERKRRPGIDKPALQDPKTQGS